MGELHPSSEPVAGPGGLDALALRREAYRLSAVEALRRVQAAAELLIVSLPALDEMQGKQLAAAGDALLAADDAYLGAVNAASAALVGYGATLSSEGCA